MEEKKIFQLLNEHVQQEADATVGDGWELDSQVFWSQVEDVQGVTGMDLEDAYDQVASHYSLLSPSHVILKGKYKRDKNGWTLDYNMLTEVEALIEKNQDEFNDTPSLEQIEDVIIAYKKLNLSTEKDTL